jgi:hypothetical protein
MDMQKWLVFSTCQTFGLANSLQLLAPQIEIEAIDIWAFDKALVENAARLPDYDRILTNPECLAMPGVDFSRAKAIDIVPGMIFRGYHPDLCYAASDEGTLLSPGDTYHSMIAIAAFNRGLSASEALALFNADMFDACGYFDVWRAEKKALLDYFLSYDLDISADFRRWSRSGGFMHSINHPRIDCLYDIARAVLRRAGVEPFESGFLPPDNLANAGAFGIYPEIGERFGVAGHYFFKRAGSLRLASLEEFVRGCFEVYQGFEVGSIEPDEPHRPRYEHVLSLVHSA